MTTVIKVDSIYLYTGDLIQSTANVESSTIVSVGESDDSIKIKTWIEDNSIEYVHLNYADANQHSSVFSSVDSWYSNTNVDSFPFLVYDTVNEDYHRTRHILQGANNIVQSDLSTLIASTKG